jgi:(p)ppGpp synthase/HD superfamily hydrolase
VPETGSTGFLNVQRMQMMSSFTISYSHLVQRALVFAARKHTNPRKGTDIPYITHPVHVALILARHGFDDQVLAAAILHDVLEDTETTPKELRNAFGDKVLHMVQEVSEPNFKRPKSETWEQRKEAKLEHLHSASREALAISAADRLHNVSNTVHDIEVSGPAVWERFRRGSEKILAFERSVLETLRQRFPHPLTEEYAAALRRLEKTPRP